jgi:rhodanese-related sulfurtransferase
LLENGFPHVNPILGGFNAWKAAGYPVESSQ